MPLVEERLTALEAEVARLKETNRNGEAVPAPWWRRSEGTSRSTRIMTKRCELGRKWRETFRHRQVGA